MNLRPDTRLGDRAPEDRYIAFALGPGGGGVYMAGPTPEEAEKRVRAYARRRGYPERIIGIDVIEAESEEARGRASW